jgi:hypothetical protein
MPQCSVDTAGFKRIRKSVCPKWRLVARAVGQWEAAGVASLSRAQVLFFLLLMKDSDLIGCGWGEIGVLTVPVDRPFASIAYISNVGVGSPNTLLVWTQ